MKLKPGDTAPQFAAPDQNGTTRKLTEYEDSWVLLYFYPGDNTPGCITEACTLRDNYQALENLMHVVGVSADTVGSHAKFVAKHDLPFTVLSDPQQEIIKAYGTNGFLLNKRTSFLIDPDGTIVKIYEKVKPAQHASELLTDFQNIVDSIWQEA